LRLCDLKRDSNFQIIKSQKGSKQIKEATISKIKKDLKNKINRIENNKIEKIKKRHKP
jgi:hypothetical protein